MCSVNNARISLQQSSYQVECTMVMSLLVCRFVGYFLKFLVLSEFLIERGKSFQMSPPEY